MWWINATFMEIDIRKYNVTNYLLLLHCDISTSLTYDPIGVYYYGGIYRIFPLLSWNVLSIEKESTRVFCKKNSTWAYGIVSINIILPKLNWEITMSNNSQWPV